MSKYIEKSKGYTIIAGYDRPLDYIFVMVYKNEEIVYSNIDDMSIIFNNEVDFNYFDSVLKEFALELSNATKELIFEDRATYLSSLERIDSQIIANLDTQKSTDNFTIKISQLGTNNIKFIDTDSKVKALEIMNLINGAFIDDFDDLTDLQKDIYE